MSRRGNNISGMPGVGVQPWPIAMLTETVEAVSLERRLLRFLVESLKQILQKEILHSPESHSLDL
jgi:hypothetical protein